MIEAFERHLKQKKNLVNLENIQTHEDLIKFCKEILLKEGLVVREKKEILRCKHELVDSLLHNTDMNYVTQITKENIERQLIEAFLEKYPIQYTLEKDIISFRTAILGKLEI
jgi:hypothetical protein